jgi:hypothetical protein
MSCFGDRTFIEAQHGQDDGEQLSAVRASGPTARPAHASAQFVDADLDAAFPGLLFLGRCDPTDPLVSRQWGDFGPKAFRSGVGFDSFPEIFRQFVHRTVREFLRSHTSNRASFAQRPSSPMLTRSKLPAAAAGLDGAVSGAARVGPTAASRSSEGTDHPRAVPAGRQHRAPPASPSVPSRGSE